MTISKGLKFTGTHQWVRVKGDEIVVGITDYVQQQLSEVTSVDLPEPDDHHYEATEDVGVIESVKSAIDIRAPVAGTITAVNTELFDKPEMINTDPGGRGWLFRMKPDDMADVEDLMDPDEYEEILPEEEADVG